MNRGLRSAIVIVACCVGSAFNHYTCARTHRIFYDEDVYADISRNLAAGSGGGVTVSWLRGGAIVERYKWPLGFPVLVLPWIQAFGPEEGPALWNEVCGALTAALIGFASARWTGSLAAGIAAPLLFYANPVTSGWYRSGSSEPSAILVALTAIAAAELSRSARDWTAASMVAFLAAMNVRLDNLTLLFPLAVWFWPRLTDRLGSGIPTAFWPTRWKERLLLLTIAIPLLTGLMSQIPVVTNHYLTGRPESSFSLSLLESNIGTNLRFVKEIGLGPFALLGLACLVWLSTRESRWLALLAWIAGQSALLSAYSVGLYSAPGGSRFLMIPSIVFSLAIVATATRVPVTRRGWAVAALCTICCISFPARAETQRRLNSINLSPQAEHDAVFRWARTLPPNAIVMSSIPYLWRAAGVFSGPHRPQTEELAHGPLYWHRGLFDHGEPLPDVGIEETIRTQYGNVSFIRIR